jgi:probable rRNA maturation factor
MIEFQINVPKNIQINRNYIWFGVKRTLEIVDNPEVDITIRFTNDEEMLRYNQEFRGIAKSTDVLSFNQDTIDPETQRLYLGDIIISYERAVEQSVENGHSFDEECALLAIHGTLHLLGYDHYRKEDKDRMWNLQQAILQETNNHKQDITS